MRTSLTAILALTLVGCSFSSDDEQGDRSSTEADRPANATPENLADAMASDDEGLSSKDPELDFADSEERPMMQLQVVLDRQGFGPGVIDGKMGMSTENALLGFQEANDLDPTGKLDDKTKAALERWEAIPATRVVRIPDDWGSIEFAEVPDGAAEQAKMERLGYESLDEKLAERFHTTIDVLKQLNPGGVPAGKPEESATAAPDAVSSSAARNPKAGDDVSPADERGAQSVFAAGQIIRVPNIGADRIASGPGMEDDWQDTLKALGVGTDQPKVARVVVSRSEKTLKGYDQADKLVVLFTVSSGSNKDPLPLGEWGINGVAYNPPFAYNPELFWDVADTEEKQQLPPGPNGPVGVIWIDLTKEHYGIHGTPEPQTIGRAQSHGCVRLTNWDAARLGQMVSTKTKVVFVA